MWARTRARAAQEERSAPQTVWREIPRALSASATFPQPSARMSPSAALTTRKPKEKAVGGSRHSATCGG